MDRGIQAINLAVLLILLPTAWIVLASIDLLLISTDRCLTIWDQEARLIRRIEEVLERDQIVIKTADSCQAITNLHISVETPTKEFRLEDLVESNHLAMVPIIEYLPILACKTKIISHKERVQVPDFMLMYSQDCTIQRLAILAMVHSLWRTCQLSVERASSLPLKQTDLELTTGEHVHQTMLQIIEAILVIVFLKSIILLGLEEIQVITITKLCMTDSMEEGRELLEQGACQKTDKLMNSRIKVDLPGQRQCRGSSPLKEEAGALLAITWTRWRTSLIFAAWTKRMARFSHNQDLPWPSGNLLWI